MELTTIDKKILDSFHLMWDLHPFPVLLVRANRDIVAVNATARRMNMAEGVKCFSLSGGNSVCGHCQADAALAEGKAKHEGRYLKTFHYFSQTYWTPLAGEEKLYVHYANDIGEFVRPELLRDANQ